ncbi:MULTISPECIES: ATP-binding cassette domain-containing protein [unclassified Treponema]|uniref:ATP-binding cassette domain-containing protein n=1 Tax=Treponema sp. OMZ 787 TaxID=2563669 RepID=UPI0020A30820|nr:MULTISPECIES: ATP-binding cassette domain-containing protein [unclassified Treponema]
MIDYILNIKDLNKDYKSFSLKNINLQIPKGTVMGFIGANGAGKTTTIKLIMQLIKKDSGQTENRASFFRPILQATWNALQTTSPLSKTEK